MIERTRPALGVGSNALLGKPDTGDTVLHRPSNEEWLVACVEGEHLYWLGWPPGRALVADCELLKKATEEDRLMWLRDLAKKQGPEWALDDRRRIAIKILADTPNASFSASGSESAASDS